MGEDKIDWDGFVSVVVYVRVYASRLRSPKRSLTVCPVVQCTVKEESCLF